MIADLLDSRLDEMLASGDIEDFLLERDLSYFAEKILDMEIASHHLEWSDLAANHDRIGINAARDHGKCLAGESRVLMSNGEWKRIDSVRVGEYILSEGLPYRINHVWSSGEKQLYKMRVIGGREIRSTAEHKFWVWDSRLNKNRWVELKELSVGDEILISNEISPFSVSSLSDSEVKLLAYAIAEGNMTGSNFHITNKDEKIVEEIADIAKEMGWESKYYEDRCCTRLSNNRRKLNSPQEWCRKYNIWGKLAYDKRVPKEVFSLPDDQVALFLNRFFACDGWVNRDQIGITLANEGLIEDLQYLLMRFGIYARKSRKKTSSGKPTFSIMVQNAFESIKFFDAIGLLFTKEVNSQKRIDKCNSIQKLPMRGIKPHSRHYIAAKIEEIDKDGVEPVYDIEVEGKHEFVANGFKVHNSFFWCFAYVIWRAYHKWIPKLDASFKSIPRLSLGYIFSNTQDQAIKHLDIIKNELETNPKLNHLVPIKKDIWSKQEIRLSNGSVIRARGWGVGVRGAHPCYVVCDDILSEENLYSDLTRTKEKNYLFSAVTPMIIPNGQLVVVGTPMHAMDLYGDLEKNPKYIFKRFPALDENDVPLWPTRYSKEMLLSRMSEVGSTRFSREYKCVPIDDGASLFPRKILEGCFDPQYTMPKFLSEEDRSEVQLYTGIDLALSSSVGADYTVITTVAVDSYKNYWIVDIRRKKGLGMTEQLREIEAVYRHWRPLKMYIENNAFQKVFHDELVRRTDLPIEGFTTTRYNKNSMEFGVPSLQILFENRKFVLPTKTERDREVTNLLCSELAAYTWIDGKLQGLGSHDDMVMSLWLAKECASSSSFSFSFT